MDLIPASLLIALAKNWEREANTSPWISQDNRTTLRECADAVRMLCGISRQAFTNDDIRENQFTISEWAMSVFGEAGSDARVAARANEEMAELIRACTSGAPVDKIVEEAADVVIVLYRIFSRNGRQMAEEVDKKMAVNRTREWHKDGTGHGYHVRSKAEES